MKKVFGKQCAGIFAIGALLFTTTLGVTACSSDENSSVNNENSFSNVREIGDNDIVTLKTIVVGTDFSDAEKSAIKKRFSNCQFASSASAVNSSYKVVICDSTSGRISEGTTAQDANIILYELEHGDWSSWKDLVTSKTKALCEQNEVEHFENQIVKFPYHFFGINRAIDSELLVRYVEDGKWDVFYNNLHYDITPAYETSDSNFLSEHEYEKGTRSDLEEKDTESEVVESEEKEYTEEQKLTELFRQAARWVLSNQKKLNEQNSAARSIAASIAKSEQTDTNTYDLEKICREYTDNIGMNYSISHRIRKLPSSKEDRITGQGSWSVQLSYRPFLVTESSAADGLYYVVRANVSIHNDDAYKGRWWNKHGGSYVRLLGYYMDNFIVTLKPTAKIGDKEYSVYFPVGCEPAPKTQSNEVSYTSGLKWGMDGSIEGGASKKDGASGSAKIGGHFELSESQTHVIYDINILNNRGFDSHGSEKVHYVSYKLQLRNLPAYKYSNYRGFDEGCDACKSTVEFNTCWIWYIPGKFTKEEMPTLNVEVCGKPTYGAMSWVSSKADLETKSFNDGAHTETKTFRKPE